MTRKEEIEDLKKRAQNKSLPASAVSALNKMIDKLVNEEIEEGLKNHSGGSTTAKEEREKLKKEKDEKEGIAKAVENLNKKVLSTFKPSSKGKNKIKISVDEKKETKLKETEEERCQRIIREAKIASKKARESAKKSAKKPDITKAKEKIERAHETIEKKIEKGEFTKAQISKLIDETKDLLKMLEKALKGL